MVVLSRKLAISVVGLAKMLNGLHLYPFVPWTVKCLDGFTQNDEL